MGLFSKDIATFDDLFVHGLQDIYYAENQILKALPKLIEANTNLQLERSLKEHLKETEGHVSRLEQIFEMREEKPKGTKCYGINGLISEGDEITGNVSDTRVLDAAIISVAQAVEITRSRDMARLSHGRLKWVGTTSLTYFERPWPKNRPQASD